MSALPRVLSRYRTTFEQRWTFAVICAKYMHVVSARYFLACFSSFIRAVYNDIYVHLFNVLQDGLNAE